MSNISYCRFENTSRDLDDCASAVENIIDGIEEGLQGDELRSAENLIQTATDMLLNLLEAAGLDWDDLEKSGITKRLAAQLAK